MRKSIALLMAVMLLLQTTIGIADVDDSYYVSGEDTPAVVETIEDEPSPEEPGEGEAIVDEDVPAAPDEVDTDTPASEPSMEETVPEEEDRLSTPAEAAPQDEAEPTEDEVAPADDEPAPADEEASDYYCPKTEDHEHVWIEDPIEVVTDAANCQEENYESYQCSVCDYVMKITSPDHPYGPHVKDVNRGFDLDNSLPGLCNSTFGEYFYYCELCGKSSDDFGLYDEWGEPTGDVVYEEDPDAYTYGHDYVIRTDGLGGYRLDPDKLVTMTEGNCTDNAVLRYECTLCDPETKGHYSTDNDMLIRDNKATVEGEKVEDAHDYQLTETIPPTCQEGGKLVYTCSRCGAEDTRDDLDHSEPDPEAHVVDKTQGWLADLTLPPTCTEDVGMYAYTCTKCGEIAYVVVETAIDPDNHSFTAPRPDLGNPAADGSYESAGSTIHDVSPMAVAIDHQDETCTKNGYDTYHCEWCNDDIKIEIDEIPDGEHQFGDWEPVYEQDGTPTGEVIRECEVCGATEKDDRTACTHDGYITGIKEQLAAGQEVEGTEKTKDATCGFGAIYTITCPNCFRDVEDVEVGEPLGHLWLLLNPDARPANCTEKWSRHYQCMRGDLCSRTEGYKGGTLSPMSPDGYLPEGTVLEATGVVDGPPGFPPVAAVDTEADFTYYPGVTAGEHAWTGWRMVDLGEFDPENPQHKHVRYCTNPKCQFNAGPDFVEEEGVSVETVDTLVKTVTPATCNQDGTITYTCDDNCGWMPKTVTGEAQNAKYHTLPADQSDWEYGTMVVGTCQTKRIDAPKCTTCGEFVEEYYEVIDGVRQEEPVNVTKILSVDVLNHVGEPVDAIHAIPPTCLKDGKTAYQRCSSCGRVWDMHQQEPIPALGHDFSGEGVVTSANCMNGTITTYTCQRENCDGYDPASKYNGEATGVNEDGIAIKQVVEGDPDSGNHVGPFVEVEAVAPTCTTVGYTAGTQCTGCLTYTEGHEEIPALGHSFERNGFDLDAVENRTEENGWVVDTKPNCLTTGEGHYECTVCGESSRTVTIDALGHIFDETSEYWTVEDPTCVKDGLEKPLCNRCGNVIDDNEGRPVPATGHDYEQEGYDRENKENWHEDPDHPSNCVDEGYYYFECKLCPPETEGHRSESMPGYPTNPENHKSIVDMETKPAGCMTDGYTAGQMCTACGKTIKGMETLPAIGHHDFSEDGVVVKEATCVEPGILRRTCQYRFCDGYNPDKQDGATGENPVTHRAIQDTQIPAKGHDFERDPSSCEKIQDTKPTCVEQGTYHYVCKDCGASSPTYKDGIIDKTNHADLVVLPREEPGCITPGKSAGTHCNACNTDIRAQKPLDPTGHDWDRNPENGELITPATCIAPAVYRFFCKNEKCGYDPSLDNKGAMGMKENKQGVEKAYIEESFGDVDTGAHNFDMSEGKGVVTPGTCVAEETTTYTCTICEKETKTVVTGDRNPQNHAGPFEDVIAIPATCTEPGYSAGTRCTACKELSAEPQEIKPLGHTWERDNFDLDAEENRTVENGWVEDTAPRCLTTGTGHYNCTACTAAVASGSVTIAALGHDFDKGVVTPANCTTPAITTYTCQNANCNGYDAAWNDNGGATGKNEAGVAIKQVTDTVGGVNPDNHVGPTKHVDEVPATCTESGFTAGEQCEACGQYVEGHQVIPELGHDMKPVGRVPAGCVNDGIESGMQCSRCGFTDGIVTEKATGHDYENGKVSQTIIDKYPTCMEEGAYHYVCSWCEAGTPGHVSESKSIDKDLVTGHDYWIKDADGKPTDELDETKAVVTKAADCVTDGVKTYTCTLCGETVTNHTKNVAIPKLNENGEHTWGPYISNGDATCAVDGTKTRECSVCLATETVTDVGSKDLVAHTFTTYVYNNDATCGKDGTETAVCDVCHVATDTRTKVGSKDSIPHDWSGFVYNRDTTCAKDGTENRICYKCGKIETRVLLGSRLTAPHTFTNYQYNNDATCGEDGTETAICDVCGRGTDTRTLEGSATGNHDWDEWVIDEPATETTDGLQHRVCKVCGAREEEVIKHTGGQTSYLITVSTAIIRTGADNESARVAVVPEGTILQIAGPQVGVFYTVFYNGQVCYINVNYCKLVTD